MKIIIILTPFLLITFIVAFYISRPTSQLNKESGQDLPTSTPAATINIVDFKPTRQPTPAKKSTVLVEPESGICGVVTYIPNNYGSQTGLKPGGYSLEIDVFDSQGNKVVTTSSNGQGEFKVNLAPAEYLLITKEFGVQKKVVVTPQGCTDASITIAPP